MDVEGLQLMISFTAAEDAHNGSPAMIQMRCWRIITKRSGQRVPRVEVEEMGPRIDFVVGRSKEAEASAWKEAMKKPKGVEVCWICTPSTSVFLIYTLQAKPKKNIETDIVGDKIGRIHLGKQDLTELQTRKMKGLKRGREAAAGAEEVADDEAVISEGEGNVTDDLEAKRQRIA